MKKENDYGIDPQVNSVTCWHCLYASGQCFAQIDRPGNVLYCNRIRVKNNKRVDAKIVYVGHSCNHFEGKGVDNG